MHRTSPVFRTCLLTALGVAISADAAAAQEHGHPTGRQPVLLGSVSGSVARGGFGADVAVVGDLDGDGVGEWMAVHNGPPSGVVPPELEVHSGRSGALLYTLVGLGQINSIFLESMVDLGDVDGDGVNDFCFGNGNAMRDGSINVGIVVVYSGATGRELYRRWGLRPGGAFGSSVAALGDVNGDGTPDYVAAALGTLDENAWVVNGASGAILLRVRGPNGLGDIEFGWATAGLDDVDGDGFPDFAIGTRSGGFVDAYSSGDGSMLWHITQGASFGQRLAAIGDLDRDGRGDLLVGEPGAQRVHVVSGVDGSTLNLLDSPDVGNFGAALAATGDVDRDGLPDFLVGDPFHAERRGRALVYSGRHDRLLFEISGARPNDLLGSGVAGGIDLDANGWPDFVVGAPGIDGSIQNAGEVSLWSGSPASAQGQGRGPVR